MLGCYLALVGLVAIQRLAETARSRRHEKALRARGAQEFGAGHFPVMVALHTLWLVACAGEAVFAGHGLPNPFLAVGMLALVIVGQTLRLLAMRSLGERWTARVLVLPNEPLVTSGAFTWIRHPNYLGVVLEIFALPLVFGGWFTAVFFTVANGLLLRHRIAVEEEALGG